SGLKQRRKYRIACSCNSSAFLRIRFQRIINLMIGETISHYRIIKTLGEGGMGVVYLAEDVLLERRVAIKTLNSKRGSGDQHFRARFLREARAVSALSHQNIANIYDYGETP